MLEKPDGCGLKLSPRASNTSQITKVSTSVSGLPEHLREAHSQKSSQDPVFQASFSLSGLILHSGIQPSQGPEI